jgi:hypothetical protein
MKLNLGKMASKLKWAYGTQQQAAAKNVSAGTWQKSKDALVKVERLFADKLQGSRDALKNAILKGRAGNLSGYVEEQMSGYLGDPASATVIAAAARISRNEEHRRHFILLDRFVDDHPKLSTFVIRFIVNDGGIIICFVRTSNDFCFECEILFSTKH